MTSQTRQGKGGAVGVVGGAVVGGPLGHQVGGGTSKTLATIGGGGGGYAGNEVQKHAVTKTTGGSRARHWGRRKACAFETSADPGFKVDEVVNVVGNELKKR